MSSKSPILLALFGLALALGVGWMILGDEPGAKSVEAVPVARAESVAGVGTKSRGSALSKPEAPKVARHVAPAPANPPVAKATLERLTYSDAIWVEGRVVFPSNTPGDEIVSVVATGRRFKSKSDDPKSYEAQVEASGRFRVALAKGTKRGRLTISAKYLYLESTVKVSPASMPKEVLLEPKLGGCIDLTLVPPGQVSLSEEELQGLQASAHLWSEEFSTILRAGERLDGQVFRMGGLRPDPGYTVALESNVFQDISESDVGVKAGEATSCSFTLQLGARVTGIVRDEAGELVAGAEVEFQSEEGWDSIYADEHGKFEKGGLPEGEMTIAVSKSGYETLRREPVKLSAAAELLDLELVLGFGNSITGIVTWPDGRPASGAKVVFESVDDEYYWDGDGGGSAEAGADGDFVMTGLDDVEYKVTARAQPILEPLEGEGTIRHRRRQQTEPYWHAELDAVTPTQGPLSLVLREGSGVHGIVVDESRKPIADFRVKAVPNEGSPWVLPSVGRASTRVRDSADGAFVLEGLKDGSFLVEASASGFATGASEVIDVPWDGKPIELVLLREGSIKGIVRGPLGEPVEGARVGFEYQNGSGDNEFEERRDTTEEDGSFELKSVAPGSMTIVALVAGSASSLPQELSLRPGEEREGVELRLRVGATIRGQIHASVPNSAGLDVRLQGGDNWTWTNTTADETGAFEFVDLNPGEYELWFEPDLGEVSEQTQGYHRALQAQTRREAVVLTEGEEVRVVLGAPFSTPILVTGFVTCGGEPVSGELVTLQLMAEQERGGLGGSAQTDATGAYSITLGGPGTYQFKIGESWADVFTSEHEIANEETVRFDFDLPTAGLTGLVLDPTGEPMAGVYASLEFAGTGSETGEEHWSGTRMVEIDETGRYEFTRLEEGDYVLRVGEADWGWGPSGQHGIGAFVSPAVSVKSGRRTEQPTIHLRPAGTVKGTVRDAGGLPVEGVVVSAKLETGLRILIWSNTRTNSAGRFTLRGLPAGKLIVEAWGANQGGEGTAEAPVEVFEKGTSEVELVLN